MLDWLRKKLSVEILSDKILIYQAKIGDKEAYGKLYLKYIDGIYRYIFFRIKYNREEAEDLTEEVFFKAWRSLNNLKNDNFKAWLYKIAHNSVIDYFKKVKKVQILREEVAVVGQSLEEKIIIEAEIESLKLALNKLTDDQKSVLTLKYIEELSNKEIAIILNISESNLRK